MTATTPEVASPQAWNLMTTLAVVFDAHYQRTDRDGQGETARERR